MATKNELVSDIELRISSSKPSDDLEVDRNHIAHLIDVIGNSILKNHLNELLAGNQEIPARYLTAVTGLSFTEESWSDVEIECEKRYYIDLSSYNILPLFDDGGIVRLRTASGKRIDHAREGEIDMLESLWFAAPSRENMLWYREGDKLYVAGISDILSDASKVRLIYVAELNDADPTSTTEYPLEESLLPMVLEAVEQTILRQMGIEDDVLNDGVE